MPGFDQTQAIKVTLRRQPGMLFADDAAYEVTAKAVQLPPPSRPPPQNGLPAMPYQLVEFGVSIIAPSYRSRATTPVVA